jgi:hypothetical protein
MGRNGRYWVSGETEGVTMGKFSAAQIDEWIDGYEQDKLLVVEKIVRLQRVLELMEGPGNEPYRQSTVALRDRLQLDVMLYDRLIADYKKWKDAP